MKKKITQEGGEKTMADVTLYNVDDMAKLLGISRQVVIRHVKKGTIPYQRIGRFYYFPKALIEKWIKDNTKMPESQQTSSVA